MKVYKYRGGVNTLVRDLHSIYKNVFFAPNAKLLNDPCETLILDDNFKLQLNIFSKLIKNVPEEPKQNFLSAYENVIELRKELGIYSLSKSYDDELLWAHYANSHTGFCIEYDLDILMNENKFYDFYSFDIKYSKKPPQVEFRHLINNKKQIGVLQKLAGVKSKQWKYENEIRIITDKSGIHDYDYRAVTGVYFGFKMPEHNRIQIMSRLRGRGIKYYEILLHDKSYEFYPNEVKDNYNSSRKYLFEISSNTSIKRYSIIERKYYKGFIKGELSIVLDEKITLEELKHLGKELKIKLYRSAKNVFIYYFLKNDKIQNFAWGMSHFKETGNKFEINGLTNEQESRFIETASKDKRDRIGAWIDETNLMALITLYKDKGKVFMELLFKDGSQSIKEQIVTSSINGKKLQDIDDKHDEYVVVTKTGKLEFYSEEGLFNEVKNYIYYQVID